MSLDPNKTYLTWNGSEFPNSSNAMFKAPAGSVIDWGDGTVESFETASETVNTHTYTDGKDTHTIAISGLTEIVNGAFWMCRSLRSATIGNGVTRIGMSAFGYCSSLTSIEIPDSVTRIGVNAFFYCSSLTSIEIPDSVTSIGDAAFSNCSSLTSILVGENNTAYQSIDGNLYSKDGKTLIQYAIGKSEQSFTIPDSVTSIGKGAFEDCDSLTSIEIPDSVTSIGVEAFSGCSSLTSITIPDGVTSIGMSAFGYCSSLTSIEIPDSVTSIGDAAFSNCSSLTSIEIPDSVTRIGYGAFVGCSNLKTIILFPETPPTLGSNAIPTTISKIYVQKSSKALYKAATNWTTFANKIVSNNIYLSFIRFNQKNKKYIDGKANVLQPKVDETLETESKEIVGAINEVKGLAETARMVFGETEGTAYEGNNGKANADNIAKLQNEMAVVNVALEQSGLMKKYKQPITQEYNERVTANGLNVLDGSKAVLKKVVGNTVSCKQLFDISKIVETSKLSKTDRDIIVTNSYGTWLSVKVNEIFPAVKAGITYTAACTIEVNAPTYASNCMISVLDGTLIIPTAFFTSAGSKYVKQKVVFTEEDLTNPIYIYGLADNSTGVTNSTVRWKNLILVEGDYTNTEMPSWQPYFTGLKSAIFGGIESTNEDGTETSTLDFPKTETPLGTTIDFDNKKITNYGVDLVLTGTETVRSSGYLSGYNTIYFVGCLHTKEAKAQGICTDGNVIFGMGSWIAENTILIGNKNKDIHWCGILEKLGYATKGTELSAEELTTAITNFKAYLAQRYADGNPVTIRYISSTLQSETDFTTEQSASGNEYIAYKGGTEKVLGNDGAEYGADNTLTQDYILVTEV